MDPGTSRARARLSRARRRRRRRMGARPFVERNAKKRARVLKGIEIATRAREIAFVRVVSREHDDARTNARRAMTSRSDTWTCHG